MFFNSFWLLLFAITALNVAWPSSAEFLSSLILPNAQDEVDAVWRQVPVKLMSASFQIYILMCLVQIGQLTFGRMALVMFSMSDIVGVQQFGKSNLILVKC